MSSSVKTPKHFRLAIAIFHEAQPLDFIGPVDVFNSLSPDRSRTPETDFSMQTVLLATTMDPVTMDGGMAVMPQMTYDQARKEHWDGVLVPGGSGAQPWVESNRAAKDFLVEVVPRCQYVLTVCTGSWLLASTGALKGQRATTNKWSYKAVVASTHWALLSWDSTDDCCTIQEHSKDSGVIWVPKARWVVSNQFWTSSGVTAGIDMAAAFLSHFIAAHVKPERVKEEADRRLGVLEVTGAAEGDDPWADYYNLV